MCDAADQPRTTRDRSAPAGVTAPLVDAPTDDVIHVMTFNVRCDCTPDADHPDHWPARAPLVSEFLHAERPTILGTQEPRHHQLAAIAAGLGDHYRRVGRGRDGGTAGEYCAIFYDTQRLLLRDDGQYWLSDTPDVVGSSTWGNGWPRIVTWAHFEDHRTGREFLHVNSHLDHESVKARALSAYAIRDQIAMADVPVLFTTDANAPAGMSEPYGILVEDGGLVDTWEAAAERLTPRVGTFPNYGAPDPEGDRIDWIVTTSGTEVLAAAINTWTAGGRYPSDHTPVQALLRLV